MRRLDIVNGYGGSLDVFNNLWVLGVKAFDDPNVIICWLDTARINKDILFYFTYRSCESKNIFCCSMQNIFK